MQTCAGPAARTTSANPDDFERMVTKQGPKWEIEVAKRFVAAVPVAAPRPMAEVEKPAIGRGDRTDLLKFARAKERGGLAVVKAWRTRQEAELETQLSREYRFTDFPEIGALYEEAAKIESKLQAALKAACDRRSIPGNFRPSIRIGWNHGGWSTYGKDKDEVRKAAMRYIDGAADTAKAQVQQRSADAQAMILEQSLDPDSVLPLLREIEVDLESQSVPSLSEVNREIFGFLLPDGRRDQSSDDDK